jgi:hypothetical protein
MSTTPAIQVRQRASHYDAWEEGEYSPIKVVSYEENVSLKGGASSLNNNHHGNQNHRQPHQEGGINGNGTEEEEEKEDKDTARALSDDDIDSGWNNNKTTTNQPRLSGQRWIQNQQDLYKLILMIVGIVKNLFFHHQDLAAQWGVQQSTHLILHFLGHFNFTILSVEFER